MNRLETRKSGQRSQEVAEKIRQTMQAHCGVFRTLDLLGKGEKLIESLVPEVSEIYFEDKSKVFNTARIEALEVENMIEVARATTKSAVNRTESRGAHALDDCPERDDDNWLKHSVWFSEGSKLIYKPVQMQPISADVESIAPQPRTF